MKDIGDIQEVNISDVEEVKKVEVEKKVFKYPFQWFNYYDFWYINQSED